MATPVTICESCDDTLTSFVGHAITYDVTRDCDNGDVFLPVGFTLPKARDVYVCEGCEFASQDFTDFARRAYECDDCETVWSDEDEADECCEPDDEPETVEPPSSAPGTPTGVLHS